MISQLNITDYSISNVIVQCNDQFEQGEHERSSGKIRVDFDIKRNDENPLEFLVGLLIEMNKDEIDYQQAEYRIILSIKGFFSFADGTEEVTINRMIAPSGLSILYGVARGVVSNITGSCRNGKFVLPSLNFVEIIKDKLKKMSVTENPAQGGAVPAARKRKKATA